MNSKSIDLAKDSDARHAVAAMKRAAQAACQVARNTHTKLIVVRDGKLLEIAADDIVTVQPQS